jgi:uncharacterized cupredoxin-like copper-binding protein
MSRLQRSTPTASRLLLLIALVATACGGGGDGGAATTATGPTEQSETSPTPTPTPLTVTDEELASADMVLITGSAPQGFDNGGFGFEGQEISSPGPTIRVSAGETLTLVLRNVSEEFLPHDFTVVGEKDESAEPLWGAQTLTIDPDEADLITFTPDAPGTYFYICSISGHMGGHGMWGRFDVE